MKNVVITGANRGIGLGLAEKLAARKYNVIGTSRIVTEVEELAEVASVMELDVTSDTSVNAFVNAISGITIDVLVNNAGWTDYPMSLAEQTVEGALRSFEVNALGPLRVLRALSHLLAENAKVINISSRLASLENTQKIDGPGYSMSKAALNMLSRQVAFDPEMKGKTIVSVSPGLWSPLRGLNPGNRFLSCRGSNTHRVAL